MVLHSIFDAKNIVSLFHRVNITIVAPSFKPSPLRSNLSMKPLILFSTSYILSPSLLPNHILETCGIITLGNPIQDLLRIYILSLHSSPHFPLKAPINHHSQSIHPYIHSRKAIKPVSLALRTYNMSQ